MADFQSKYLAKPADEKGYVQYTPEENETWHRLFVRQKPMLFGRATPAYIEGIAALALSEHAIPQLPDVNARLQAISGWQLVPVPALITAAIFFDLLSRRLFPAATFIRDAESLDYVEEPDIFHEVFGHAPMLTQVTFADFIASYAKKVMEFPEHDWPLLQRLFWFTVEFGLIKGPSDARALAYGGGILSSYLETDYSVNSPIPLRKPFDVVDILRTPYRIDEPQKIYFVLSGFEQLYDMMNHLDFKAAIQTARQLGEHAPLFEYDPEHPAVHINAC